MHQILQPTQCVLFPLLRFQPFLRRKSSISTPVNLSGFVHSYFHLEMTEHSPRWMRDKFAVRIIFFLSSLYQKKGLKIFANLGRKSRSTYSLSFSTPPLQKKRSKAKRRFTHKMFAFMGRKAFKKESKYEFSVHDCSLVFVQQVVEREGQWVSQDLINVTYNSARSPYLNPILQCNAKIFNYYLKI